MHPFPISPASEFPNDNPELHLGTIWTFSATTGEPEPELARDDMPSAAISGVQLVAHAAETATLGEPPMKEPGSPGNDVPAKEPEKKQPPVEEPPTEEPATKKPTIEEPPVETPQVDDPEIVTPRVGATAAEAAATAEGFAVLVRAMSRVATAAGVAVEEACIFDLFVVGKTPTGSLPAAAVAGLVAAGYADDRDGTLFTRDAVLGPAVAWRAILRGEAADFAVCGTRMLDEWAADVVARLLGTPQSTEALRRELRRHGVAAFGLLENAA